MEIKPVQIQSLSFSIPQRIVKGVQVACLLSFVLPAFAAADSNDLLTVRESKYVEMQQTQKVSGSVSDDFGPLVGVSIHVKGTTNGTVTDMDGNFSLEAKPGDILLIS